MSQKNSRSYVMNFVAFICFLLALALVVLLRLFQVEEFVSWYNRYTETLESFDRWIQANGATWFSVAVILLNYTLKAVIPWFPLSCICVAAGVLFKWYYATAINIVGLTILFSLKFFWGRRYGGGNAEKILSRYDRAHNFIDSSKLGSSLVLFFLRLVPGMPVNSVSQLYGTTDIGFFKYLVVSLFGFSYKLFSYTTIGRNVFDPATAGFIVPLIFLLLFTGMAVLSLNGVISLTAMGKKR